MTRINLMVDIHQPGSLPWEPGSEAMKRHKLLSGETVDLEDVEPRNLAFLKNLERLATSGISFF